MSTSATSIHPHDDDEFVSATQRWLERAVIGLNLCPFARRVHVDGRIRYRVTRAEETVALERDLRDELRRLQSVSPDACETTLLIHPFVLGDFLDYNDFLGVADDVIAAEGLTGVMQIASFHPAYRFAGTRESDLGNFTNRSPYPVLQLLREASIERALESLADPAVIYERNIETLEKLGREGWQRLLAEAPAER